MKEYGRIGQKRWEGQFYEEFLPELSGMRGIKVFKEMKENDDTVGGRTDSCCDGSGGESETDLLSAGSSCGRNSDRVRDWNCRRKDFTGCEERSCKDSIDIYFLITG